MRRKYNPFLLPPWLRTIRGLCKQLIIPFTVFQGIRTIIIPTAFDVILLLLFLCLAAAFHMELL